MPENQPGAKSNERDENGNIKPVGRRGFLRGLAAGAALLYGGQKLFEKEKSTNDLYKKFEDKQHSFQAASEAANLLIGQLEDNNIDNVKLSGTSHPNEDITILRDFLTTHLNSKGIGDKYEKRDVIFAQGYYDKDTLMYIKHKADLLLEQKYQAPSFDPPHKHMGTLKKIA